MSLERSGYLYAKYHGSIFKIYSEVNQEDNTIELIGYNGCSFIVNYLDIKPLKVKKAKKLSAKIEKKRIKQHLKEIK